ncbi:MULTISPECIES: hypothetical protein [unclassified Photobacterium]|nr:MULTISPECIES: hypothetical protein [unclassified Photobacterium]
MNTSQIYEINPQTRASNMSINHHDEEIGGYIHRENEEKKTIIF